MVDCKMSAMLIPFGHYRNAHLLDLKAGDELITIDEPACHLRIVSMNVIPVNSPITNALSMLIYGYPIERVYDAMVGNHGPFIHRNKLILIIYEHLYTESYASLSETDDGSMDSNSWPEFSIAGQGEYGGDIGLQDVQD
jgi:hypothetical protein